MEKTLRLLRSFYGKAGHRGICFLIYLLFLAIHILMSASAELPSIDPNEFGVASVTAFFTGKDWSAAMSRNSYFCGYVQAALYTPVMLLTDDPFVQYRLMVCLNGVLLSFVPVIVYSLCRKIGAQKPWQAGFAALICGGTVTYFAHSKFIWNETLAMLLPWLAAWLMFKLPACRSRSRSRRAFLSVVLGFLCALSVAAHGRLIALALAVPLALFAAKLIFKKQWVSFPFLLGSAAVFGVLQQLAGYLLQQQVWQQSNPAALLNTAEHFFADLGSGGVENPVGRFFVSLVGQIYYFICSGWGMTALGIGLFITVLGTVLVRRHKKQAPQYSESFVLFGIFTAFLTFFMLLVSVFYKYGGDAFYSGQDNILFGRYLDGVLPFTVLFVLLFVFMYDLQLTHVLYGVIVTCLSFIGFYLVSRTAVLEAETTRISPTLGLYPLLIGEDSSSALTGTSLMAALSCGLCVLALLVVIICCSRKNLKQVATAFLLLSVAVYSSAYAAFSYLPLANSESRTKNAVYVEMSKYVYNRPEAPEITVYKTPRNTAQMMQFLNQNTRVSYADEADRIPLNTFVILPETETLRFSPRPGGTVFTELARVEGYRVYVYGDKALAYVRSQQE